MNSMKRMRKAVKIMLCLLLSGACLVTAAVPVNAASKKKAKAKNIVICLDPGHDTTHHGCTYGSFEEGYADLAIAMFCKQELETYIDRKLFSFPALPLCQTADPGA